MDQAKRPVSEALPLGQLVAKALSELEDLGYARRSLGRYRATWRRLVEFSREKNLEHFSDDLALRFVEEFRAGDGELCQPGDGWRRHIAFEMKVLGEFAQCGRIVRRFTETQNIQLSPSMEKTLGDYEEYCRDRLHLRPWSIQNRSRELTRFLDFLGSKARTLGQIQATDLSEFVSSRGHLSAKSVSRIVSDIRSFLRFLTMRGILDQDLSPALPKIRVPNDARIPSVWDKELVAKLLEAIDRSSAKGKRDFAILLLACRLGLRAGDIRTLKLDDLKWEESRVEIWQSKTDAPLSLPLTEEVGEALIDYLQSGRPETEHREVFLKLQPPFDPFTRSNLYHIITYWRRVAGVTFRVPQRKGLHSLRHSLATRLLEDGTPFSTISDVLGHRSPVSTSIYAKADVEALRDVALSPEEVHDGK
jgi:site-specific recombinase XerD